METESNLIDFDELVGTWDLIYTTAVDVVGVIVCTLILKPQTCVGSMVFCVYFSVAAFGSG